MSHPYETVVTLTLGGDEQDVRVRAHVFYERQFGGSWGGSIDGEVSALISGEWTPLEDLDVAAGDIARAEDALCDACSNDDRCCA